MLMRACYPLRRSSFGPLFKQLKEHAAAVPGMKEGVALPTAFDDPAVRSDAFASKTFRGGFHRCHFAADVMHASSSLIDELLDEAIGPQRLHHLKLQQAAGNRHHRALVPKVVFLPAALQLHAENALLPFDLPVEIVDGHRHVVDALEVDRAAASFDCRGLFGRIRAEELPEDAAAFLWMDVRKPPHPVVGDAAERCDAKALEFGCCSVDIVDFEGDVVEARAALVQVLLYKRLFARWLNDFELDAGAADFTHGAAEILPGVSLPAMRELKAQQSLQLFRLGLPTFGSHADVIDAFDRQQWDAPAQGSAKRG